jgi:tol-pal system protein YbgF
MKAAICAGGRARRRAVIVALAALALPACATKKDVKNLRDEMVAMQMHQDSLFRETQRQNRLLLDTMRTSFDMQRDAQGQTSHRFQQLEQNLKQLEEMLNQTQILFAQLMERLERQQTLPQMGMQPQTGGGGAVEPLYAAAVQRMQQGSYATARLAFEEILREHPTDPRAVDAQYQLAETYNGEKNYDRAIEEFEKLERQYARTDRAPEALLRAGIIAQEQKKTAKARELFQAIQQRYPLSDARAEADRRLRSIRE